MTFEELRGASLGSIHKIDPSAAAMEEMNRLRAQHAQAQQRLCSPDIILLKNIEVLVEGFRQAVIVLGIPRKDALAALHAKIGELKP